MYFSTNLNISGLTDIQYIFYNAYNSFIGEWSNTNVLEEGSTGIYGANIEEIPDNAVTIRWRSESNPTIRSIENIAKSRYIENPRGIIYVTEDDFKFRWDTRTLLNGESLIEVYALGSDNLWAKDSVIVDINNQLSTGVVYKEFEYELGREGYELVRLHFGLESKELSINPQKRGWLQLGVRTTGSDLPAVWTEDEGKQWWEQFKVLPLESGVRWKKTLQSGQYKMEKTDNVNEAIKTQIHNVSTLDTPSRKVFYGLRITPYELMTGYALDAEKVRSIKSYSEDEYLIITENVTKLFSYNGSTLKLLADFSQYSDGDSENFGDALDAVVWNDKIYFVTSDGKLGIIDTDEGDKPYIITPTEELKPLKWVEVSNEGLIAIYGDNTSTTAYALEDLRILWSIDKEIIKLKSQDERIIMLSSENIFYIALNYGTSEPVVEKFSDSSDAFPYPVIDFYSPIVYLNNGDVYEKSVLTNQYILIKNINDPNIISISYARIGENYQRPFFGQNNNQIIEMFQDGSVSDNRTVEIENYNKEIISIPVMWHYEKLIEPAQGTIGNFDYVPAVYDDRLLMGANGEEGEKNAILIVLEKSPLNESMGAQLVSQISDFNIFPKEIRKSTDYQMPIVPNET